jgi:hypothetical protein
MFGLIRLAVLLFIIYFLYKLFKSFFLSADIKKDKSPVSENPGKGEDLVEDPYCHRYLPLSQTYRESFEDREFFFCSRECCNAYKKQNGI